LPDLIVVYGPPLSGKTSVAWQIARLLPGKSAVVSADQLIGGAIATPDEDRQAELEMAHTQLRLLVANYLKNRYNVVVEGPFLFERDDRLLSFEPEIDQLLALMRNLARRSLIVRLDVPEEVLRLRAEQAGRLDDLPAALRIRAAARGRYGLRVLSYDVATQTPAEIAAGVLEGLTLT
jgi:hypothetical protein